ncbi:amidase [Sediminibacterium goheungense]|uniref:Asp-tRNA(Asn)/Glu-tRNA(Gln) amidotransferase A subunit family amidase n=1 Tax=Sediminibacterium goheungense TaxID=1086393 RepID=A0A4R6J2A3_9BACT|nr:amidase [Sediminibacterium goheungense]TDO29410.1 Asp-tRNA(Asn)/Glu-tRNA(Gln) amidotransferase A subunit family amidase [Sediminibacterium goheungense]
MRNLITASFILVCSVSQAQDTLSKNDIPAAARLIDLKFTQKEIDSMYPGIKENEGVFKQMHKQTLANHITPTLTHSAILPGMVFNEKQEKIDWKIPKNVVLPENRNELAWYSIPQLASLLKNKKISSTELTKFFIERIKKYGDSLQCVISIPEKIAMEQAAKADAEIAAGKYRGALHGIPYGLKDLFAVKGTKTTWGAEPYKNQVIDEDAFVYTQLKEAGAVLVAKFTLGALAMGDYWYGGRTKNPWNTRFGSSGSSAGSASATVAGLVPFAIGTETWGSIISPASTCGATGLRPTFGAISRSGAMTLSWSLDKVGPICRSAEDAAIVFNYIKGTDGKDLSAVNKPFNYKPETDIRKMKIGYAKNYFDRITDTSRTELKVLQAYRDMGVELIPVDFPDSTVYPFNIMDVVISAECAAAFDDFTRNDIDDLMTRQGLFDWPNTFRVSRFVPAVEYINANRHRNILMQKVNEVVNQFDVIICPTRGSGNQSAITNLTGHPVLCVPTGFDRRSNTPTSISFIGKLFGEASILTAAKYYQDKTGWDEMHPPAFK